MAHYTNKIVVVTGGSKGIGGGVAKRLAAEGATVVVNYVSSKSGAEAVVSEIEQLGGHALALGGNVADEAQVTELFEAVRSTFGRVYVLVNNAGVYAPAPFDVLSVAELHRHFDINVLGLLLATKAAIRSFPRRAAASSTSVPASARSRHLPLRSMSAPRARSMRSPRAWPRSLPQKGRVNAVRPGFVLTEASTRLA